MIEFGHGNILVIIHVKLGVHLCLSLVDIYPHEYLTQDFTVFVGMDQVMLIVWVLLH